MIRPQSDPRRDDPGDNRGNFRLNSRKISLNERRCTKLDGKKELMSRKRGKGRERGSMCFQAGSQYLISAFTAMSPARLIIIDQRAEYHKNRLDVSSNFSRQLFHYARHKF